VALIRTGNRWTIYFNAVVKSVATWKELLHLVLQEGYVPMLLVYQRLPVTHKLAEKLSLDEEAFEELIVYASTLSSANEAALTTPPKTQATVNTTPPRPTGTSQEPLS
jgi:hypothetical protein